MTQQMYHYFCHSWPEWDSRDWDEDDHWDDECGRVSKKKLFGSFRKRKIQQIKGVRVT